MEPNASDLTCPRCQNVDMVYMASSYPRRFALLQQSAQGVLAIPFGAFMLVCLLASLPFAVGSAYKHLTDWPPALSAMNDLLPKPLICAAAAALILLVTVDRSARAFLLHTGRAAALDSRLYRELDARASSLAPVVTVGIVSLGWGAFLGLKSLDLWLAMATSRSFAGPDFVPLAVQGFLAGGLVALAGLPLMAFIMARAVRLFADYAFFLNGEATPSHFARNLAYPYVLLPVAMGLASSSGVQLLSVLAAGWFLAAIFVATRHTVKQSVELALPAVLVGAAPVILAFFFVSLRVQTNIANSNWDSFRGRASTLPDVELSWLIGALALAAFLGLTELLAAAWTRRKIARIKEAWQQAIVPWRHILYCERCDGVHLPNQRDFVPVDKVGRLLPGSSRNGR